MKVLLFGASGVGTTTLGVEIERLSAFKHLDLDDFYWKKTEIPFEVKVPLSQRNEAFKKAFFTYKSLVVSGSISTWGDEWSSAFDLAVFISMDASLRMKRLRQREEGRYGKQLYEQAETLEKMDAFLDWASQYDKADFDGRSIGMHRDYIKKLQCPVVELDGASSVLSHLEMILPLLK